MRTFPKHYIQYSRILSTKRNFLKIEKKNSPKNKEERKRKEFKEKLGFKDFHLKNCLKNRKNVNIHK